MVNYYDSGYHEHTHKNLLDNKDYYEARAKLSMIKYFNGILTPVGLKNAKILEYGCGLGQNISMFPNAYGYDISTFAMKECNKKGIKTIPDLTDCNKEFDVVFSRAVLEHLDRPLDALKLMNQCLKPGGTLILVLGVERQKDVPLEPSQNQHLYGWNFQTINNLLFKAGFVPISNEYCRGTGYNKLLFLYNKSLKLYRFATSLAALVMNSREIKIVAIKKELDK